VAGESWSPRLTRGLWGVIQRAVREGLSLADARDAARAAGERPDAATLSHLYSRAVAGASNARAEADYATRVDRETYLARRPSGRFVARLPQGFSMSTRWRQVVAVTGVDPVSRRTVRQYVNIQSDRLLSRGEAIDMAIARVEHGSPRPLIGPLEADYDSTWSAG
jgi:hypothetical protein